MNVVPALAAPAMIPLPASSPAVAVTIMAAAAADRRVGFMSVRSLIRVNGSAIRQTRSKVAAGR
jgi:hypothetical protein